MDTQGNKCRIKNITELLKITLPIILAPMAGNATTPELIAAVSNAGGLGSLGAGYMNADEIRHAIKKIRQLTDQPFAINLFIPQEHHASEEQLRIAKNEIQAACSELNFNIPNVDPPYTPSFAEQIQVIVEESVPIFSFTFGILNEHWLATLKENNILLLGTATTLTEAKLLEQQGIDIIIAQGSEAGGHRGTFLDEAERALNPIASLIPELAKEIRTPIIAAGGIMNGINAVELLNLGASGLQLGTAFLCCPESGMHQFYRQALINNAHVNTVLTRVFSGKLARGLPNKFIARMQMHLKNILDYPIQNALTSAMRKEAITQNNIEFMSMWAGEGINQCNAIPAREIIEELKEALQNNLMSAKQNF